MKCAPIAMKKQTCRCLQVVIAWFTFPATPNELIPLNQCFAFCGSTCALDDEIGGFLVSCTCCNHALLHGIDGADHCSSEPLGSSPYPRHHFCNKPLFKFNQNLAANYVCKVGCDDGHGAIRRCRKDAGEEAVVQRVLTGVAWRWNGLLCTGSRRRRRRRRRRSTVIQVLVICGWRRRR